MMVKMCDEEAHSEKSPADIAAVVAETNKVILVGNFSYSEVLYCGDDRSRRVRV